MDEYEVYEQVLALLTEIGFVVTERVEKGSVRADLDVSVTRNGHTEDLAFDYHPRLVVGQIDPRTFTSVNPLVFVTDWLSEKSAAALRRRGAQYVDLAGNAHLQSPGWTVDIRGRKPDPGRSRRAEIHSPKGIDIYSPKRAQVIFVLLCWPELQRSSLRDTARAAGVSLGLAQSTVLTLKSELHLRPDEQADRDQLIRDWVSAYRGQLGRTLTLRTYHADTRPMDFDGMLVSGETAVPDLLRSDRVVGYVDEVDMNLILRNRWRADGSPNVVLRHKFWNSPESAGSHVELTAPPLLVYADLATSPDVRTRQAAEEYRKLYDL